MKKIFMIICFLELLLIIAICIPKNSTGNLPEPYKTIAVPDIEETSDEGKGFTCTGLARDADGSWWVGSLGQETEEAFHHGSSIIHIDEKFETVLEEIPLDEQYIQGVAFDSSDNSLWYTNGSVINNIEKSGGGAYGVQSSCRI